MMAIEDMDLDELFAAQVKNQRVYPCSKCGYPFTNHYTRQSHEAMCINGLLLPEPEPVESVSADYRAMLIEASKRDPAYVKYANREDPAWPDNMTETCMKVIGARPRPRKKKLDQLEYEDIPDLSPGKNQ